MDAAIVKYQPHAEVTSLALGRRANSCNRQKSVASFLGSPVQLRYSSRSADDKILALTIGT